MCAPRVFNANTQRLCCTASVTSHASSWNARCGAWVFAAASEFRPRLRYRMFCSVCSHVRPRTLSPHFRDWHLFLYRRILSVSDLTSGSILSFQTWLITNYFEIKLLSRTTLCTFWQCSDKHQFRRQALTSQLLERHQFDGTCRRAYDVTSDSCRVKLTSNFTSDSRI